MRRSAMKPINIIRKTCSQSGCCMLKGVKGTHQNSVQEQQCRSCRIKKREHVRTGNLFVFACPCWSWQDPGITHPSLQNSCQPQACRELVAQISDIRPDSGQPETDDAISSNTSLGLTPAPGLLHCVIRFHNCYAKLVVEAFYSQWRLGI